MTIKLIAMDMDGTLLRKDNTISPRTKEVLLRAQEQGITLVLASGRSYSKLLNYAEELKLDEYGGYLVEVNGMAIYDVKHKQRHIRQKMPKEAAHEIFEYFSKWNVEIIGNMDAGMYVYNPPALLEEKLAYKKEQGLPEDFPLTGGAFSFLVDNRKGYPDIRYIKHKEEITEDINKISITYWADVMEEVSEQAKKDISDRYWVGKTTDKWLEIMMPNITKATGLEALQEMLGITMNEVMAFGDGENDIEMLQEVGMGFAMANALEEAKAAADYLTDSNMEDGIANAIEKYILS